MNPYMVISPWVCIPRCFALSQDCLAGWELLLKPMFILCFVLCCASFPIYFVSGNSGNSVSGLLCLFCDCIFLQYNVHLCHVFIHCII